jgi:hypothetical protein
LSSLFLFFGHKAFPICYHIIIALAKRQFTIDIGKEQIPVEGHMHRNVAVKYLMKRRRSLLMTRNPEKVEKLWSDLPNKINIIGKQVTRRYMINWERLGSEEFEGSRFAFTLEDWEDDDSNENSSNYD